MTPVQQLYWIRVVLGIIAGLFSAFIAFLIGSTADLTTLINAFTIALIVYLISYYALRGVFRDKIEKQSKILSTAVLMYFLIWLPFFVLFYTMLRIYY